MKVAAVFGDEDEDSHNKRKLVRLLVNSKKYVVSSHLNIRENGDDTCYPMACCLFCRSLLSTLKRSFALSMNLILRSR
jgi:hypothetical protein